MAARMPPTFRNQINATGERMTGTAMTSTTMNSFRDGIYPEIKEVPLQPPGIFFPTNLNTGRR
jgi:hypothetical protein